MSDPSTVFDVPTPALLLDRARLIRNTDRMARRARDAGVALRPHMKTAKSVAVAKLATRGHDAGITVSTVAEAEYFAANGYPDQIYAVVVTPDKLERLAGIQSRYAAQVSLLVDDPAGIGRLDRIAGELSQRFNILIEIDSGEHRSGVPADAKEVLEMARALDASAALDLGGVLTHGGHAYGCDSVSEIIAVAEEERDAVVRAAQTLRDAGFECPTVSAGSTPTAVHAESFEGLTEIRPGVYMFYDLAQLGLGVCREVDLALSVLATVIGHQRRHQRLIIDAGALALSKDTSAQRFYPDAGFGWVADPRSQHRVADLRVAVADQEHGYVEGAIPYDALPVGSRVRVLPNHACITAAAHECYWVTRGDRVIERWSRIGGW